ncbi:olfactory receptor 52D1-like [Megalops cyprinoides]|uniref:olfactory receptor 52D1-like n=1 Tax=Megalops cyprinoides TaxID=118141 RepID=UPI001865111C|nr:olfactory receptor 52D1-like [Megalops cyprinoides]
MRYSYFLLVLILYLAIIISNSLLIGAIYLDRQFHKPMYFFVCNLCVNGLYGSMGLFPCLLVNILSDTHEISLSVCMLQTYCLHTYGICEFATLAVMAYDRYVSICNPLQYHRIMSSSTVIALISFVWLFSACHITVSIYLTSQVPLCEVHLQKLYCDNFALVKLACNDITLNNVLELISLVFAIVPQVSLIIYSYVRILKISLRLSGGSQVRAINTCTPHIMCLANFSISATFEALQSRFDMSKLPHTFRITASVYFLISAPLLNPIIYGMRSEAIRKIILKILHIGKGANVHPELMKKHTLT